MLTQQHFMFATLVVIVICCLGNANTNVDSKDGIYAKLSNVRCECVDETFCKVNQCILKAVNRMRTEHFANVSMLKRPITNTKFNVEFYRKYTSYQSFPVNITVDICNFLANPRKNPLFNNIYKMMKETSNMNHSCPFDEEYIIIRNFSLFYNPYFNFLPEGSYRVNTKYIVDKQLRWTITYWFDYRNPKNTFLS